MGTYSGDFQPIEGSTVIVASIGQYFTTQLMRSPDNGSNWQLLTEGEDNSDNNLFIAFHPEDPAYVYAGNKISEDAGITFTKIDFPSQYESPTLVGMCQSYPDIVYALDKSRNYLLRSNDRGTSWNVYAHPGWRFRNFDSKPIFATDPADSNKIYTISSESDLAVFDGKSWKSFNILGLAGGHGGVNFVSTIAIDPNFPDIIYAGTFEKGLPCIFRTIDGGDTWEDITTNLPRGGASSIAVNPHTGELFRGSGNGTWIFPGPASFYLTSLEERNKIQPENFKLMQNYPNPFNQETIINFQVSISRYVELDVFNILGQKLATLVASEINAGEYQAVWNGKDNMGQEVDSGIYFYQLKADNFVENRIMLLIR